MGAETHVEWADFTHSFWLGCLKVSPECENCYAEVDTPVRVVNAKLRPKLLRLWGPPPAAVRHLTSPGTWARVRTWNREAKASGKRKTVFCNADSDFFEDFTGQIWEPDGKKGEHHKPGWTLDTIRKDALFTMALHEDLEWLVLTKRPENVRSMVPAAWLKRGGWPQHIRIGTTAGTKKTAAKRLPYVIDGPWQNFVSAEPLLEDVDYTPWLNDLHWLIVGGESGPKSRPCDLAWVRSAVKQCQAAKVPVFVKQLGALPVGLPGAPAAHTRGGDLAEMPEDLRVREFARSCDDQLHEDLPVLQLRGGGAGPREGGGAGAAPARPPRL